MEKDVRADSSKEICTVCPKCGHEQKSTLSCRRCGVIFGKFVAKEAERPWREYSLNAEYRIAEKLCIGMCAAGGIAFIWVAHHSDWPVPGYILAGVLFAGAIIGSIIIKTSKPFSVLVSDKGITVAGKTILWTHIKVVFRYRRWSQSRFIRYHSCPRTV